MPGIRIELPESASSYVALAERLGCPLVTTDTKLAKSPGPICTIEVL